MSLQVPRLWNLPFETELIERYQRRATRWFWSVYLTPMNG